MNFVHATLRVKDLERGIAFYNGILGFPVARRFGNIVFLGEEGKTLIELIELPDEVSPSDGITIGVEAGNPEAIIEKIKASFDTTVTGPQSPNPSLRFFFVTDPDGYTVQLIEYLN